MSETPSEPTGVAGSLLSELEAGGELIDEGGFTIDSAQALDKLRAYQLADANAYVLLLVEAAVLAGENPVRIDIVAGDVGIRLGAIQFTAEELEQLFAAVFISLDDADAQEIRRRRALQKLAFACNAALRLSPKAIVVECGELRLRLSPDDPTGTLETIEAVPHTRVHVDRTLLDAAGEPPEAALLRSHCAFSPVAIELDGARISKGSMSALRVQLSDDFVPNPRRVSKIELDGQLIGRAALRYGGGLPAEVTILCNGVLAERFELGDAARPAARDFAAIVDIDLPKDLGQNKLLRGPEFEAVMHAIWAVHDRIAPAGYEQAPKRRALPRVRAKPSHFIALVLWLMGIVLVIVGEGGLAVLGIGMIIAGIFPAMAGLPGNKDA